ncbi:MAG: hypothetical protein U1E22_02200 [Coriobacteriia bacterium]|nr:hypothetical protein [Coriobacteriia bacterium]
MAEDETTETGHAEEKNDLVSLVEKIWMMGFGAAELTKEKLLEFAGELEKRGRMSDSDAKNLVDRVTTKASEQGKALGDAISREVEKATRVTGGATRADVDSLREELTEIKKMIARIQPDTHPGDYTP